MNKRMKIPLIFAFAVIAAILLPVAVSDTNNAIMSSMKREGIDILLPDRDICAIAIKGRTLWAGGVSGLFKIDMKSLKAEKAGDYKFIRSLLADGDGLWIGHDNGLTHDGGITVTYTTEDGLPDNRVNTIMLDGDNRLWAGTWGGAAVFDRDGIKAFTVKDGLLDNMVNVIMQDSLGGMWFGSYVAPRGGISVLYDGKWQYFTTRDALLHSNINAIIQRRDKSVVAGGGLYTKGGGTLFVFESDKWVKKGTISKQNGLAGEKIRSLFEDSRKRLWVGSEYDGLAVISGDGVVKLTEKTGLSNDEVKVIKEDEDKNIWVGTLEGLVRISEGGMLHER